MGDCWDAAVVVVVKFDVLCEQCFECFEIVVFGGGEEVFGDFLVVLFGGFVAWLGVVDVRVRVGGELVCGWFAFVDDFCDLVVGVVEDVV